MQSVDCTEIFQPLGFQRNRILCCLGADLLDAPAFRHPSAETDPFAAYRRFVQSLSAQWAAATDRTTVSLLAAARLLYGDLSSALLIVHHLPTQPIRADRTAGICLRAPLYALETALPFPLRLRDSSTWLAGTSQQAGLYAWITESAPLLQWNEREGVYVRQRNSMLTARPDRSS
jgi:hypothetical protein